MLLNRTVFYVGHIDLTCLRCLEFSRNNIYIIIPIHTNTYKNIVKHEK